MWAGVSFGRYRDFARLRFALLVAQLVAGFALMAYVVVADAGPPLQRVSLAVVPLLLAGLWGRFAGAVALAQIVVVVAAPVVVVNVVASIALFVPGWVIQRFVDPSVTIPIRPTVLGGGA